MVRLAVFAVSAIATSALVVAVNWWVDPLGDVYDASATRAALDHACVVSDDVVGVNSWWDFKHDLVKRAQPDAVVVGTSRSTRLRAGDVSELVNLALPGTAPAMLSQLFRELRAEHPGRLTVYLGVELFWLNDNWAVPYAYRPERDVLRELLTRQRLGRSVALLWRQPSLLVRRWYTTRVGAACAIDRAGRAASGDVYLWHHDGALTSLYELRPDVDPPTPDRDYETQIANLRSDAFFGAYYGNWKRLTHLGELRDALALARSWGWTVVAFTPPYSPRYVEGLSASPLIAPRWRDFGRVVPALFAEFGFEFVDTRDGRRIGCAPGAWVDDGWHPDAACSARVLRLLEAAAR